MQASMILIVQLGFGLCRVEAEYVLYNNLAIIVAASARLV